MNPIPDDPLHEQLLRCAFPASTGERAAFLAHLRSVALALGEIARTERAAAMPGTEHRAKSETERAAIRACLADAAPPLRAFGPVADACRSVLDGYEAGECALDAGMLQRLVRLGDLAPVILADEARLTLAFGALRQVLLAFDHAEHRDPERQPQASAALQAVHRVLGLPWPPHG